MNPIKYVMGLVSKKSTINNERIASQLAHVRDTLNLYTIPQAEKILRKMNDKDAFGSEVYRLYNSAIIDGVQTNIRGNMFVIIKAALDSSTSTLVLIDKLYVTEFRTETSAAALTLTKGNILQLLDTINLVATYSRSLMDAVLVAEENRLLGEGRTELNGVTEAEIQFLANNRDAYIRALNIVLTPVNLIEERFKDIPEIVVSEIKSQAATSVHGDDRIDPLRFGLFQSKADPIWLIGTVWNQYQFTRFKAAKEQAAVIELRIERLRNLLDKKPNPRTAQIISKYEGQRDLLLAQVRKKEREWNA